MIKQLFVFSVVIFAALKTFNCIKLYKITCTIQIFSLRDTKLSLKYLTSKFFFYIRVSDFPVLSQTVETKSILICDGYL